MDYKRQLKLTLKQNSNFSILQLVKELNLKFNFWNNTFFLFEKRFFYLINFYLCRNLLNFILRRYPKKKKTSIYERHYFFTQGKWTFTDTNVTNGIILSIFHKSLVNLFCFPICLNFFEYFNKYTKLEICLKRGENMLKHQCKLLWKKQKGVCFKCKRPLYILIYNNSSVESINSFNKNTLLKSSIVLVHRHCI